MADESVEGKSALGVHRGSFSAASESLMARAIRDLLPQVRCDAALAQQQGDIWRAAETGDLDEIARLLRGNPRLHSARNHLGLEPLHYASFGLQPGALATLLRAGADPNARREPEMLTPVLALFLHDPKEITPVNGSNLRWKRQKFGFRNPPSDREITEDLWWAEECACVLADFGADVSAQTCDLRSALWYASAYHDLAVCLLLLGADPNPWDGEQHLLHSAITTAIIESCQMDLPEVLLEYGADPNCKDLSGRTPLHLAAGYLDWEFAGTLVDYGASLSVADCNGDTPLKAADEAERFEGDDHFRRECSWKGVSSFSEFLRMRGRPEGPARAPRPRRKPTS